MRFVFPEDCRIEDGCVCLDGGTVDLINREMLAYENCLAEEPLRSGYLLPASEPWWKDKRVVVGGVVVSFGVGLWVGALFGGGR